MPCPAGIPPLPDRWTSRFRGALIVILINVFFLVTTYTNRVAPEPTDINTQVAVKAEYTSPLVYPKGSSQQQLDMPWERGSAVAANDKFNMNKRHPSMATSENNKNKKKNNMNKKADSKTLPFAAAGKWIPVKKDPPQVIPGDYDTLDDWNYCAAIHLGNDDHATEDNTAALDIPYQCQGPRYNAFSMQLHQFAAKKS